MTNIYNKQLFVNEIFGDGHKYEWQAVIDEYSSLRKWITVGESLTSNEFFLIFPNSIAESKWKLSFYPNGQYVNEKANNHVGIYLILLSCENRDIPLTANVTFRLKPANDVQHDGNATSLRKEFVYSHPNERWVGKPDWLSTKKCSDFFVNDTLVIQCSIEEAPLEDDHIKNDGTHVNNEEKKKKKENVREKEEVACSNDDFESNHPEWNEVKCNKKKQKPGKKQQQQKKNNKEAPKPKNNNQQKRKNKSNKGGKKK